MDGNVFRRTRHVAVFDSFNHDNFDKFLLFETAVAYTHTPIKIPVVYPCAMLVLLSLDIELLHSLDKLKTVVGKRKKGRNSAPFYVLFLLFATATASAAAAAQNDKPRPEAVIAASATAATAVVTAASATAAQ